MIVGNGMLAKTMYTFLDNDEVTIFASGVSNSKETREEEFLREIKLLGDFIKDSERKLIYFSTCAVLHNCESISNYISHKKKVETLIRQNFENYIIFRLPNVVGKTENKNTSFNFFKNQLISGSELNIEESASRYFIDVDDIRETLTPIILDRDQNKKEINVCFNNKINVLDFVRDMAGFLNINPRINILEGGCAQTVDNSEFIDLVGTEYKQIGNDYNLKIIKKYC